MTSTEPTPPNALPTAIVEAIEQLDKSELRAVIEYAQRRYEFEQLSVSDRIEAGPGEEIVRIEENPVYTTVVKRQPCGKDCEDCPHGPFLYHVQKVPRIEGESKLQWRYLGTVNMSE
ncbi:hypothetical protein [Natranaeroarchaeum aerophilus]|uniref:Uncharacterized protein n=1 Tax=Natranaeroarchaeum aerophilus TaxID=2917711 RepID=A0AAE3K6G4_9EURY|nr:hypothetical protein [Natranaeroarchaeum aerophilus]MCL9815202.1 hypothetical protein [Natranaeroarchaeum aerophilus]